MVFAMPNLAYLCLSLALPYETFSRALPFGKRAERALAVLGFATLAGNKRVEGVCGGRCDSS
jgi:hypothetical protein